MGICPKCNSQVESNASVCSKCNALLDVSTDGFGTIYADPSKLSEADQSREPNLGGTLSPSDFAGSQNPQSDLSQAVNNSDDVVADSEQSIAPNGAESDEHKTVVLPGGHDSDGDNEHRTWIMDDESLRAASAGSKGKSGSSGQLRRVWEEAIGSSGKDSKQSLRYERAEASDSVFRRVATRQVADANASESSTADYQIQDKVGEGGMGIVFSAKQTAVNRIVAIKSIRGDKRGDATLRKQFFYEAEITAELDHPNIPPIYELGTTGDGLLFYSMKLIQGTEWQKLLPKMSRDENLEIYNKIADAVAFAHSKNVIHRDLKPDNVMLGTFGEVYLTDWGLGVNLSERKKIDFGGTPDFMSPEMATNRKDKIGKASDIYLLGGILFQIVTGMPPHIGRTPMDRLKAASQNEIASTKSEDPLLDIARVAMSTELADRYPSVGDLQAAIALVRKNAKSIELAERSSETAKLAESSKDYDRFTRAMFGFRDAIDMWSENKVAKSGLQQVRYAYGNCAFEKGDYDLALHTLDRSVDAEAKLYDKATKAKLAVVQREQRFKTLRSVFALAIVSFLAISTALAGFASWKWRGELAATNSAKEEAANAITARNDAEDKRKVAEAAEKKAVEAQLNEEKEKMRALAAEDKAKEAEMSARDAETKAIEAKENESKEKEKAIVAEKAAIVSAEQARIAELDAKQRAAQIQIGDAQSKTSLARLQLDQFDIQGATKLLNDVRSVNTSVFGENPPKFDSWAMHRVNLLSNADLPKEEMQGVVTAIDFAQGRNVGVVGTANGNIHKVTYDGVRLKVEQTQNIAGARIDAVAISPNGDEAVVTLTRDNKSQMLAWPLGEKQAPIPVTFTQNRSFQQVVYSLDGKQIVAGINGGIWSWKREGKWYSDLTVKQDDIVNSVKGRLTQLQWIDSNNALATSTLDNKTILYHLKINAKSSKLVELPELLASNLRVATFTGRGNRMLFGMSDGSMFSGNLDLTAGADKRPAISNLTELPKKHRTALTQIITHPNGELLSVSDEPVAHVWRVNGKGDVSYDTFLSGVPSNSSSTINLARVAYISEDKIAGVDELGSAVVWSVERQKQRRQLTRTSESGVEQYPSPVINVFNRSGSDQALAVSSDGVVDLWNLHTGKTIKFDVERWSYYGHTPGAEFVDSAVDLDADVVVTSASLKNAQRKYLGDATRNREYCVWDLKTGNMLHRWLDPSDESIAPRISLLGERQMLIASDKETRVVALDGKPVFKNEVMGTYMAIPNPRDPSLVAMIKRSGLTWLWDRKGTWNSPSIYVSEEGDREPTKAIWTKDGQRLYLIYDNGRVLVYEMKGRSLSFVQPIAETDKTWTAFFGSGYRVPHHYDLDFAVSSVNHDVDQLFLNLRIPGATPKSRQTKVDVSRRGLAFSKKESNEVPGTSWLDETKDAAPSLTQKIHSRFSLNNKSQDQAVSRLRAGEHVFVSTRSAKVYELSDKTSHLISLARQPMLSATSDRNGNSLLSLHKEGALWKFELSEGNQAKWYRIGYTAEGCTAIAISPDGQQLAMLMEPEKRLKIVAAPTGALIQEFDNVVAFVWDPKSDATLAIGYSDGKLVLRSPAGQRELESVSLKEMATIKSLNFFYENWSNEKTPPVQYVLVQSEDESNGFLSFVPVDKGTTMVCEQTIGRGARLMTSPTDSIFVTGESSGTVSVWFASPTWKKAGQLFDLEGHLGAGIACLAFSGDGNTLVTSDRSNRLFGWMSQDSLNAKSVAK